MTTYNAAMRGVPFTLQSAGTVVANGEVILVPPSFRHHRITIIGNGAVGAGAVQPESASEPDYAGTWNPVGGGPITVPAASEIEYTFEGEYNAIRCRISTEVTVGTVTATYTGAP